MFSSNKRERSLESFLYVFKVFSTTIKGLLKNCSYLTLKMKVRKVYSEVQGGVKDER